jgi:hypothetical protein
VHGLDLIEGFRNVAQCQHDFLRGSVNTTYAALSPGDVTSSYILTARI